jgi:hypothetical protein
MTAVISGWPCPNESAHLAGGEVEETVAGEGEEGGGVRAGDDGGAEGGAVVEEGGFGGLEEGGLVEIGGEWVGVEEVIFGRGHCVRFVRYLAL